MKQFFRKLELPGLSKWLRDKEQIPYLAALAMKDKCTRINGKPVTLEDAKKIYEKAYGKKEGVF